MTVVDMIVDTANTYGVDPNLALAVARRESGLNQAARGAAGEIGVFQLMPTTAAEMGVNPYDLVGNIQGGIGYLRQQIDRFGDLATALAAYNWGPGNVAKWGPAWPQHAPASTQAYVASILGSAPAPLVPVNEEQPVYGLTVFGTPLVPEYAILLLLLLAVLIAKK